MQSGGIHRRGSRPGNTRVRRGRRRTEIIDVKRLPIRRPSRPGVAILIGGFLVLIAIGTVLLMLPFASRDGDSAGFLRALFTATSSVCVTGLAMVDTRDHWTPFGQVVILVLVQLGGLGFMTSATLLLMVLGRRMTLGQQFLAGEAAGRLGSEPIALLIRRIVIVTLIIECVGVLTLTAGFAWHDSAFGIEQVWRGLFTSISAFNNAGFDLEGSGRGMSEYQRSPLVLVTLATLVLAGSTGYAVWSDVMRQRRWVKLHLNTKIVLSTTLALSLLCFVVIVGNEHLTEGSLSDEPTSEVVMIAATESVYVRTSGFSTMNVADIEHGTAMVLIALMFIGGASASTAGGIKINTFSVLFFAVVTSLRGNEHVHAFGREISWRHVNRALTVALLALAIVVTTTFLLAFTLRDTTFDALLFEAVSAFATCGLSLGLTRELDSWGSLVLCVAMFLGRLGPLTFALALAQRFEAADRVRYAEANVNIG